MPLANGRVRELSVGDEWSILECKAPIGLGGLHMTVAHLDADPVIEAYKRDVDRTLLRQNLKRSVAERLANLVALQRLAGEARKPRDRTDN